MLPIGPATIQNTKKKKKEMDMRKLTKLVIIRRHTAREWKHQSARESSTGRKMKLTLIFEMWFLLYACVRLLWTCGTDEGRFNAEIDDKKQPKNWNYRRVGLDDVFIDFYIEI